MLSRDYRDVVGGGTLLVSGIIFSWYAFAYYDLGTVQQMGPGMFPAALGLIIAGFGLMILLPALFRPGVVPRIRVWTPLFVLLGIAAFAVAIRPFGLIPAILAVVVISSFAELMVRPISLTLQCTLLCLLAWLVFRVGLGLPIPMFRGPF